MGPVTPEQVYSRLFNC